MKKQFSLSNLEFIRYGKKVTWDAIVNISLILNFGLNVVCEMEKIFLVRLFICTIFSLASFLEYVFLRIIWQGGFMLGIIAKSFHTKQIPLFSRMNFQSGTIQK